jgi:hypothetical protein
LNAPYNEEQGHGPDHGEDGYGYISWLQVTEQGIVQYRPGSLFYILKEKGQGNKNTGNQYYTDNQFSFKRNML